MYKVILSERRSGRTTKILDSLGDNDVMIVDSKHYISRSFYGNKNVVSSNSLYTLAGKNIDNIYIDCVQSVDSKFKEFIFRQLSKNVNIVMYQDIGFISMEIYNEIKNAVNSGENIVEFIAKTIYDIDYTTTFKKYYMYGLQAVSGEIEIKYGVL